ncbi:uncharacterized protein [Amphiura filiformis]|uniref:uncharacterized protein n=1 Tax=Amphiura filiformis TaxID=82378 RepID=UPI003B22220D
MGYGRGKDSKSKKSSRKEESSSESDSDQSNSSDSSYTSTSDSEPEPSKKQKLESTSKKKHKKEQKKEKKKEKKKKEKEAKNKISKDDFYHKSTEFRLWLVEEKSKYFDQLSSSKSKAYFKKFVKQWNSRKLAKKYYKGIDVVDARTSLTKYKWKFAEKMKPEKATPSPSGKIPSAWKSTPTGMSPPERTFSTFGKAGHTGTIGPSLPKGINLQQAGYETFGKSTESIGPSRPVQGPSMPGPGDQSSPTERRKSPGSSQGRKRRGDSPDADSSYMGMGDDFHKKLANRQKHRDQQKDRAASKLIEYQARERDKMSKLLELARANKSKDALW